MKDQSKTKQVLIHELTSLRQRITELEQSESERKPAEEALLESEGRFRGMAGEMAVIAEISRVIGSTLEIDEVYERFAAESKKLILVDSLAINLYNFQENTMRVAHVSGVNIDRRKQGDPLVLEGSLSEAVIRAQTGLRIQPANIDEIVSQFPRLSTIFQAGLRSIMCVPLVSRDEVIGVLHFRSKTPNAYTEKDLRLAERIGAQIAGAIANAQLFSDLKQAEEALQRVHNELEQRVADRTEELMRVNEELRTEITERKRAEEAIVVAMNDWENTFDTVTDMITIHDKDFNIVRANPAAKAIFGLQLLEELPLAKCFRLYHGTEKPPSGCASCQSLKTEEPSTVEIFEPHLNKHLEIRAMPRFGNDHCLVGLIHVVRDISDRKRAEEEKRSLEERLNRAEKMEALGVLAGGVAHDLNNVLGIVVGYAELLLLKANESSAIRPKLLEIMKGGQKAAAMVQDLLTLARRGVPVADVLNLNSVISDCRKSPEFEQLFSFHPNVQIRTEIEPELPNISGSSVHLGKTIFNLISNASEAMPKGGVLTIKTANHYLDKPIHGYDEIREGDYVVLSVSDTGEGISAGDIKRVFEPFYTKKVMGRSGTGLGLAVVWGTVKDHHGYINVHSEEKKGSTFTLYFPVTRKIISAEHVAVSISEYMGKGESILIVDDVREQRELATVMLKELNYSVASVKSGEEAVTYLKEHKADLMVLDMLMDSGIDGLDTYRRVLGIHPRQKAIIVSGFSESDRVKAAQALGAGTYVRKPYDIEKLGLAVKKELDRTV